MIGSLSAVHGPKDAQVFLIRRLFRRASYRMTCYGCGTRLPFRLLDEAWDAAREHECPAVGRG